MTCDYCKRRVSHYYQCKNLCVLHFLFINPSRNKGLVDWDEINKIRSFKPGEKKKLDEIRKTMKKLR